jgi:hypothetical protein
MKFKMLMTWLSTELMDKVAEIIQVLPMGMRWYLLHYVQSKPVGKYLNFVKHHPQRNGGQWITPVKKLGVQLQQMDFCKGRMFGRMRMLMMQLGDFTKASYTRKNRSINY